jgi:hypothetical protein
LFLNHDLHTYILFSSWSMALLAIPAGFFPTFTLADAKWDI